MCTTFLTNVEGEPPKPGGMESESIGSSRGRPIPGLFSGNHTAERADGTAQTYCLLSLRLYSATALA